MCKVKFSDIIYKWWQKQIQNTKTDRKVIICGDWSAFFCPRSSGWPRAGRKRTSIDVCAVSVRRDPRQSTMYEYLAYKANLIGMKNSLMGFRSRSAITQDWVGIWMITSSAKLLNIYKRRRSTLSECLTACHACVPNNAWVFQRNIFGCNIGQSTSSIEGCHKVKTYQVHKQWILTLIVKSLSPLDALKHFTSLKTDLIFLQPRVLEQKFPWYWFIK